MLLTTVPERIQHWIFREKCLWRAPLITTIHCSWIYKKTIFVISERNKVLVNYPTNLILCTCVVLAEVPVLHTWKFKTLKYSASQI